MPSRVTRLAILGTTPETVDLLPGQGQPALRLLRQPLTKKNAAHESSDAIKFIDSHYKDAAIIAASLRVPTEMILGLSGIESNWGRSRFAREGNNYFSQHAGKHVPFQKGSMTSQRDGMMSTFGSYIESGRSFEALYGNAVRGIQDPIAFAQALVYARFNSGQKGNGGNKDFVTSTAATIKSTKHRMQLLH